MLALISHSPPAEHLLASPTLRVDLEIPEGISQSQLIIFYRSADKPQLEKVSPRVTLSSLNLDAPEATLLVFVEAANNTIKVKPEGFKFERPVHRPPLPEDKRNPIVLDDDEPAPNPLLAGPFETPLTFHAPS